MKWIKLWTEEVIKGTTFSELTASERGVWFSLLALAGIDGTGRIEIRLGYGYSDSSLSEILNIEKSEMSSAIKKLIQVDKIFLGENGVIIIKNFSKYQDEYSRQKPYRANWGDRYKKRQRGWAKSYRLVKKEECILCAKKKKLHTHHIDRNPENNSIDNLCVLCSDCHREIHNKETEDRLQRRLQDRLQRRLPAEKEKERERKKEKEEHIAIPDALKAFEPDILNWLAYKRERGESYKPREEVKPIKASEKKYDSRIIIPTEGAA